VVEQSLQSDQEQRSFGVEPSVNVNVYVYVNVNVNAKMYTG
jgi:hypothetical protein